MALDVATVPLWLHVLALTSVFLAIACAIIIAVDEVRDPQHMWIMNLVWPVVALFGSCLALWGYLRYGKASARARMSADHGHADAHHHHGADTPFPVAVGKGASHCGAGCTIGDIIAEFLVASFPVIAVWFGYRTLFAEQIFAVWILDFVLAFTIGVAFQYFAIKPMRDLSVGKALREAVKADALSLSAWQIGMYGFMALAHFWLFAQVLGVALKPGSAEFWFMMQIAMLCGFATAYPVNWWLIRRGIKEAM